MLEELRKFGGASGDSVRFADDKAGYALMLLPKEKLLAVLDLPGILYAFADTDDSNYRQDDAAKVAQSERKVEPVPPVAIPYPKVATTLAPDGPYFAAPEIGLDKLWQRHPEADGRGVVAALLDTGLDLLHPAMQQARDADGKIVPKIVDQVSYETPEENADWVQLGGLLSVAHGTFEAAGRRWTVPAGDSDGLYRFGIYKKELMLGTRWHSHTKKLPLAVGMLMDERSQRVWVDTNGDGSFADETGLTDYAAAHTIAWFGKKVGDEDNRIPFGVKIDNARHAVFITIEDEGGHGAAVVGALAANKLTGGLYDGAAPGAQVIDVRSSYGNSRYFIILPEVLQMAARPDVGVLSRSGDIGAMATVERFKGHQDFQRHVLERMVVVYDKPMACVCSADGVIGVDDYVSGEMLQRNRRAHPPYLEAVHGIYGDGAYREWGLVNNVYAPSGQLNIESRYMPGELVGEDGKRYINDTLSDSPAPDGYWIGANESPTVPVVSGVIADLISEARREHVRYNTARINQAIFTSAKAIDGIPMYEQGYGLINAAGAWDQVVKMAKVDDPTNPMLTSFTVSQQGEKIDGYYREVTMPGGIVDGEISVARHGGYAGGRTYTFALRGDADSYTLLTTKATLEQNQPVKIRFKAKATSGFHVVFVELIDEKTGTIMQMIPLSVKVPDVPKVLNAGVDLYEATMAPRRDDTRLVYLGDDVQAARWKLQIPYDPDFDYGFIPRGTGFGPRSTRFGPGGKPPIGDPIDVAHHIGPLDSDESLSVNEKAGFQYVLWQNRAFDAEYETPYNSPGPTVPITGKVTVTKYAVAISKGADDTLTVINKLAEIEGELELYDATLKASQLVGTGSHAMGETERTLPDGLSQWRLRVTPDDDAGPADAFLLNCTGKDGCYVAAHEEISASAKALVIDRPEAGEWKIVVRSRERVSHPVSYETHEALLVPTLTPIEQADNKHASGATWTIPLPEKRSDARYAAFRIAGTTSAEQQKDGLTIAMTPLDENAP
jgi:hypothetical protein